MDWLTAEEASRLAVVVSDELSDELCAALGAVRPADLPLDPVAPFVCLGPSLPEDLRDDPRLRWFHSSNAGVDALLGQGPWPEDVLLTRTVGRMGERIAQYVLGWMLAESQSIPAFLEQTRERVWRRQPTELLVGGLAVVYGVGGIGAEIGGLLRRCGVYTGGVAGPPRPVAGFDRVVAAADAPLPQARWVVSALPLTDATRDFFDAARFGRFAGATFVNVGRGATVDLGALESALLDGRVRSAVLDVLPGEPPAPDAVCWRLPRTVITSHTSGVTEDSDVVADFTACLHELRAGELPRLTVHTERGY